ncbi:hypothetical protein KO02_22230 [Sphingobacterium sp. ML3W]|uniref:hypothetical protein n=1 Tax=Sphingobacterium sp. ML3W TaxID=1538644 RepID=UPI0004F910E1|nr:hypothetical protein [Sphingobacterium sp. ML3W]AIM39098.1 hypothetical protein KO02_22230 [Sphingobacterium sp. ML3W]
MNIINNRFDNGDLSFKIRDFSHYVTNVYGALPELDVMHCYLMMKANELLHRSTLADNEVYGLLGAIQELSAWPEMQRKGCVWFSFHIGPYHLLAQLLAKLNLPLYVLVSKQVYEDYHHQMLTTKVTEHICLINVEDNRSIWRIQYAMKKGIQILVYLDGNMGAGPKLKHGIYMPLGDRWWYLSTVLAKLAQKHDVLVVSIWLMVDDERKIQLKLGVPQTVLDERVFIKNCFLQFYRDLLRYPEQWKGWLFAHHDFMCPKSISAGSGKSWCFPRFLPYPVNDKYFLLERSTGLFYETNAERYRHVCKGMEMELSASILD